MFEYYNNHISSFGFLCRRFSDLLQVDTPPAVYLSRPSSMPHYSSWGTTAQQNRLPPTPPEYQDPYLTPMSTVSDHGYYLSHGYHSRHTSSRNQSDKYQPTYTAQRSQSTHAHPQMTHMPAADYSTSSYNTQIMPQYPYHAAPILPPIRVADAIDAYGAHYIQPEPKKEEKPTGGVAQHLDYEMSLMSSFVTEMAQKLVNPDMTPSSQFRKYVSQILSSTRLPSSTIMLGLFYLSARMKIVNVSGPDVSSSGTVYRMLTTCLLLGSKFLDDNTFQNRSWAEVSSIPVQELNVMELEWLQDFNWEIHNIFHKNGDLDNWIDHWHMYEKRAKTAKAKEMQKLAPIDTTLRRSHSVQYSGLMSPDGPIPRQYQIGPQYDTQWARPYLSEYSPPSAPHSGPATPEYYPNWSYGPTSTPYSRQNWSANSSAYAVQQSQLSGFTQTPTYQPYGFNHPAWSGHGSNCGCTLCAKHSEYYFTQNGYGMQTVAG